MKLLRQFDIGKIKVIWVGVSIVSTVSTTVEIEWPEPMKTLISIYSWTQLDLWSGIGISCYYNGISSFHGHAIFTSLAPMAVWALIWSTWFLRTTLAPARRDTDFADVDVMGAMERAKVTKLGAFCDIICTAALCPCSCAAAVRPTRSLHGLRPPCCLTSFSHAVDLAGMP